MPPPVTDIGLSVDDKRVYFTNSLCGAWDDQFYPDGVGAWMAKLDAGEGGGISFDERFFLEGACSGAAAYIRSGSKEETRPVTPTASRDRAPSARRRCLLAG